MTPDPTAAAEARRRLGGIGFFLLAMLLFAMLDAGAKYAARTLPSSEIVWIRYTLHFFIAALMLRPWAHPQEYRTRRLGRQTVRATFLLLSTVFNFMALRHLQLAQVVTIGFGMPFLLTAVAGPLLGEWAGPRRWAAVIVGFVGVLIVVQPGGSSFHPAMVYAVGSMICYAGYGITTRQLSSTDSASGMLLYSALFGALAMSPVVPAVWVTPSGLDVCAALAVTGIAGAVGHWFLIRAYEKAPVSVVAPFQYSGLVWSTALGFVLFGDVPGTSTYVGAAVIVGSGLYLVYRERTRGGS